ncbi:MAG: N-acetylneuraminate synthase family protein [Pseudodesulfovibrio sp.]
MCSMGMGGNMLIGTHDTAESVFTIAEIGNNHEGDFGLAKEMIAAAAEAGVDAVKFQTIVPDRLVSSLEVDRVKLLSRFRFSFDQFADLAAIAGENNVIFLSTPFDIEAAQFLNSLVPAFKIASSDNTFYPLIECIAEMGKPVLMSAGLCESAEVQAALGVFQRCWDAEKIHTDLALLHCVSAYPTPDGEAGLMAIAALAEFGVTAGYSDHTLGIDAAVLSVAVGARIVEKHFTIDKKHSDFRDHQLSADPEELAIMVQRIRQAERMMGVQAITCAPCESNGCTAYRRSVVAASDLPCGTILEAKHLTWVRPGGGVAPGSEEALLGRELKQDVKGGEMLLETCIK